MNYHICGLEIISFQGINNFTSIFTQINFFSRFWNDLYLKEGFASYLGFKILGECEYFKAWFPGGDRYIR